MEKDKRVRFSDENINLTPKEKLVRQYEENGETFLREEDGRLYFLSRTCKQYDVEVPKE
jgi:hypothetical protein